MVTNCGRICFAGRKINFSHVFAGQKIGVTQVGDRIWLVSFMHDDLGYFDDETCRLEPIENPFGPKVLPMSPECTVTHVSGMDLKRLEPALGLEPRTC
jgi:putative transposase